VKAMVKVAGPSPGGVGCKRMRSYTADQKRRALDLYVEHDPAEAARRTASPPGP
jgi:hypothetical protein